MSPGILSPHALTCTVAALSGQADVTLAAIGFCILFAALLTTRMVFPRWERRCRALLVEVTTYSDAVANLLPDDDARLAQDCLHVVQRLEDLREQIDGAEVCSWQKSYNDLMLVKAALDSLKKDAQRHARKQNVLQKTA